MAVKKNLAQQSPFKSFHFYIIPALIAFGVYVGLVLLKGPITNELYIPNGYDVSLRSSEDQYLNELTELIFEQNRRDFQKITDELTQVKEQLKESISGFQDKIEQIAKETAEKVASTMPAPALPNFADENKGARIYYHPKTYQFAADVFSVMDVPLFTIFRDPSLLIRHSDTDLTTAHCFPFEGTRGEVIVELPKLLNITQLSYVHLHPALTPEKLFPTQPRLVDLYLGQNPEDFVLIHSAHIKPDESEVNFKLESPKPAKYVKLAVIANYGADFTCLYRLKAHGKLRN